jgi:hypothetical protein
MNNEILKYNIAGQLASFYVNYLAGAGSGNQSHSYFQKMWKSEFESRMKLMNEDPTLIEFNQKFNSFYNKQVKAISDKKMNFVFA